jgi:hypothetical protein
MLQTVASLIDDTRVIISDRNMFIIQATDLYTEGVFRVGVIKWAGGLGCWAGGQLGKKMTIFHLYPNY